MKENHEHEVENIFDVQTLNKTLKRVKRRMFLRTIFLSTVICLPVFVGIQYFEGWWMQKKVSEGFAESKEFEVVMKASNTFFKNDRPGNKGLFQRTEKREVYKIIEDKVFLWDTEEIHYRGDGGRSTFFTAYSLGVVVDKY